MTKAFNPAQGTLFPITLIRTWPSKAEIKAARQARQQEADTMYRPVAVGAREDQFRNQFSHLYREER